MSSTIIVVALTIIIFVIGPIAISLYRSWKVPKAWNALEEKRRLDVEGQDGDGAPTRLCGTIRQKAVEVWMDTEIAADGQTGPPHAYYTNIEVPLEFVDDSLICIQKSGITPSIWRKVVTGPGGFDYKSDEVADGDDPDVDGDKFDARFDVAGNISEPLRQALRQRPCRILLHDLLKPASELHIEDGTLRYVEPGRVSRTQRLKKLVDDTVDIALHLDDELAVQEVAPRSDLDDDSEPPADLTA